MLALSEGRFSKERGKRKKRSAPPPPESAGERAQRASEASSDILFFPSWCSGLSCCSRFAAFVGDGTLALAVLVALAALASPAMLDAL